MPIEVDSNKKNKLTEFNTTTAFVYLTAVTIVAILIVTGSQRLVAETLGATQAATVITVPQAIALTIFALICGLDYIWVTPTGIWRPTVAGTVAGIILGNPLLGLITGSLIEFSFLGLFTIGGGTVPEAASGTIVAVMLGYILRVAATPEEAVKLVPIAIPVAALTMNIEIGVRAFDAVFTHWADREIAKGNFDRIGLINIIGALPWGLSRATSVGIFAALGATPEVAESLRSAIMNPAVQPFWNAMSVAGWWMPALGVAIMLKMFYRTEHLPYFLWGFFLAAYFGLSLIGVAIFSVVLIGAIYIARWVVQFGELKIVRPEGAAERERILTKSDINKAFWLSWFIQSSWNYERMMGTGFAHGMLHIEKKLRKTPEELKEWLTMHSEFYNTEPHLHNIILGMVIAMEEGGADIETIRAVKTALMGPFAGLGDSLLWFTILPISFAIGASLGSQGNFLGPIIAMLIWIPVSWAIKYYSLIYGYRYGEGLAQVLQGDVLKFFREAIAAFAVAMMGGIGASYVTPPAFVEVILTIGPVRIQTIMDMIFPRMLALLIVLYAYWMIKSRNVSYGWAVISLFLTGLGLGLLNVIGPAGAEFTVPSAGYIVAGLILLIIGVAIPFVFGKKKAE